MRSREIDVLYIEDQDSDAERVHQLLQDIDDWSIQFKHERDPKTGLELLESSKYELLLLDYHLNGFSGDDVLRRIESDNLKLPVIILTGRGNETLASEVIRKGADDYLPKNDLSSHSLERSISFVLNKFETQKNLLKQAQRDELTGLYNRSYFREQLQRMLESDLTGGLFFLDLHQFRVLNDVFGYALGDKLLTEQADRLRSSIDNLECQLARWNGDVFSILLHEQNQVKSLEKIADQLMATVRDPFTVNNQEFYLRAKMGVITITENTDDPESVITNAELALSEAKKNGRKNIQFFKERIGVKKEEEFSLLNEFNGILRDGKLKDQLEIFFQPQVCLKTDSLSGMEALVRWRHPQRGLLGPGDFLPLIEGTSAMIDMDRAVFELLAEQIAHWNPTNGTSFSFNVSPQNFMEANFINHTKETLENYNLDPDNLEVELTESALIENSEANIKTLSDLRDLGISITLDDFGKGFSSFNYLKNFPINVLKIDRKLVMEMHEDEKSEILVEHIVRMSRNLGIEVVAEGVEYEDHMKCLKQYNCDRIQGYLISKPKPSDEAQLYFERPGKLV